MKQNVLHPVVASLLAARGLVADRWCKGFGHDGYVCAMEALWTTAVGNPQFTWMGLAATSFLLKELPSPWTSVVGFNDAPDTTLEDILALYDRAIERALKVMK